MDISLKKKSYFNKKVFYTSLVISIFLNILILIFFSTVSKIVSPPKLPEEPKIRFIEIEKEEEIPLKPKKKVSKAEVEKKNISKATVGEEKAETLPKEKVKPAQIEKGQKVKRETVVNQPKAILPPKKKKVVSTDKKQQNKNTISTEKPKEKEKVLNKPANIIKTEKKVEKKLPPPPKTPVLDESYSLSPPKTPDVVGGEGKISDLVNVEGIKEGNPSKLLEGIKTVSPTRKEIQFGKDFKEYDNSIQGTAKTRKLIYMPPPPNIKTKIILPPKSVKVKIWITPDGRVSNIILLKRTGDPSLDKAIIEYVKAWRFNKINTDEVQWAITTIRFKVK